MPRTIRARITAAAVVIVAAMLSVVSVVLLTMFRAQLLDNLDESLQNRAETIGAVAGRALRQPAPPGELSVDEDLLIQIVAEDRRVLMSSQNLSGVAPISQLEPGLRTVHVVIYLLLWETRFGWQQGTFRCILVHGSWWRFGLDQPRCVCAGV